MMPLAQLDFGNTVATEALNALFTAVLVGLVAGLLVRVYERHAADRRRQADELHDDRLQDRDLEYQTRAALRETYAQLLVAQRRSRQASAEFAKSGGESGSQEPGKLAETAHAEFIDLYHRLNLDATQEMWLDARGLRHVLDDMLRFGREGNSQKCDELMQLARSARQNLERSFRIRLKYDPLQKRRDLGTYDKD
jgi:hypothetical protein